MAENTMTTLTINLSNALGSSLSTQGQYQATFYQEGYLITDLETSALSTGGNSNIMDINGITGNITIAAGTNITVNTQGNTITVATATPAGSVTSLSGLSGAVTLVAGPGIAINSNSSAVRVSRLSVANVDPGNLDLGSIVINDNIITSNQAGPINLGSTQSTNVIIEDILFSANSISTVSGATLNIQAAQGRYIILGPAGDIQFTTAPANSYLQVSNNTLAWTTTPPQAVMADTALRAQQAETSNLATLANQAITAGNLGNLQVTDTTISSQNAITIASPLALNSIEAINIQDGTLGQYLTAWNDQLQWATITLGDTAVPAITLNNDVMTPGLTAVLMATPRRNNQIISATPGQALELGTRTLTQPQETFTASEIALSIASIGTINEVRRINDIWVLGSTGYVLGSLDGITWPTTTTNNQLVYGGLATVGALDIHDTGTQLCTVQFVNDASAAISTGQITVRFKNYNTMNVSGQGYTESWSQTVGLISGVRFGGSGQVFTVGSTKIIIAFRDTTGQIRLAEVAYNATTKTTTRLGDRVLSSQVNKFAINAGIIYGVGNQGLFFRSTDSSTANYEVLTTTIPSTVDLSAVAVLPNGRLFISGNGDNHYIYNISDNTVITVNKTEVATINDAVFTAGKLYLATSLGVRRLDYDSTAGTLTNQLTLSTGSVASVATDAGGDVIIAALGTNNRIQRITKSTGATTETTVLSLANYRVETGTYRCMGGPTANNVYLWQKITD
jgi:hypothetical protein